MHKQHRTATVKVGLLTIMALIILVSTVIWLRGRSLGGGHNYQVAFSDVDGLREGAPVQFMGIRVGYVDDITVINGGETKPGSTLPKNYVVQVTFSINKSDVAPPKGSIVSIEQSGIIGEKFLEIMPPRPEHTYLMVNKQHRSIHKGTPIVVRFSDGLSQVGEVQHVIKSKSVHGYIYELTYKINRPGYLPKGVKSLFNITPWQNDQTALLLVDPNAVSQVSPSAKDYFSIEEPLRIKEFFEQQLTTAESMKKTNEKINSLLTPDVIASIQGTLKNSEQLTEEANTALTQVNKLLNTTGQDLKSLIGSAQTLTASVTTMTNNVNEIVEDPSLKKNLLSTVASVKDSTEALAVILNDPDIKLIMSDLKTTANNSAELSSQLKRIAADQALETKVNNAVDMLNSSLTNLSEILEDVETVTEDKQSVKAIINNTEQTSANLNKFSKKLNKRFLLFRLLF